MARSPAHYLHSLQATGDKPEYQRGRALHSLVLGGDTVIAYEGVRHGKKWETFKGLQGDGKEILTAAEYHKTRAMAAAVRAHPIARKLLESSRHEVQVEWSLLGRACSSRIDMIGPDFIGELKTCQSAEPERFLRQAQWYDYHAQIAWYQNAAHFNGREGNAGPVFPRGIIIAVESAPPYPVTVVELTPHTLEQGHKTCRLWLERLLACEASNEWPGYVQDVVKWDIPVDDGMTYTIDGEDVEL